MTRPCNFSADPATLPEEVLQQAAAEMLDWHGGGMRASISNAVPLAGVAALVDYLQEFGQRQA